MDRGGPRRNVASVAGRGDARGLVRHGADVGREVEVGLLLGIVRGKVAVRVLEVREAGQGRGARGVVVHGGSIVPAGKSMSNNETKNANGKGKTKIS